MKAKLGSNADNALIFDRSVRPDELRDLSYSRFGTRETKITHRNGGAVRYVKSAGSGARFTITF